MRWWWLPSDSISPRRNSSGCRATISRCPLLEQNAALVLAAAAVLGEERRPRLRIARDDCDCGVAPPGDAHAVMRSEEHTSELQSRLHLVCRLLLEKKKKKKKTYCTMIRSVIK